MNFDCFAALRILKSHHLVVARPNNLRGVLLDHVEIDPLRSHILFLFRE